MDRRSPDVEYPGDHRLQSALCIIQPLAITIRVGEPLPVPLCDPSYVRARSCTVGAHPADPQGVVDGHEGGRSGRTTASRGASSFTCGPSGEVIVTGRAFRDGYSASSGPMSQPPPCGRESPSKSKGSA